MLRSKPDAQAHTTPEGKSQKNTPPKSAATEEGSSFNWCIWLKAAALMAVWSVGVIWTFMDVDVTLDGEVKKGLVPRFILSISCECSR